MILGSYIRFCLKDSAAGKGKYSPCILPMIKQRV